MRALVNMPRSCPQEEGGSSVLRQNLSAIRQAIPTICSIKAITQDLETLQTRAPVHDGPCVVPPPASAGRRVAERLSHRGRVHNVREAIRPSSRLERHPSGFGTPVGRLG